MSTQREDVAVLAKDRWHSLLPQLGVSPRHLTRRHCACPMCGGTDRFRYDNKEGRGTWICNQCGAGDGFDLAMRVTGMGFAEVADRVRELVRNVQPDRSKQKHEISPEQQRRALISMYEASDPIQRGDPVDRYLHSRGVGLDVYPPSLRIIPSLRHPRGGPSDAFPVMLAVLQEPGGLGAQMHRTFIERDGTDKAPIEPARMMMQGEVPDGSAVRLAPEGKRMGIAEGIETALSAMRMFEMPVWAALSTALLANWQPPLVAEEIYIFADADPLFGGQCAAYALARRLARKDQKTGRQLKVRVEVPTAIGIDWNDILQQQEAA